MKDNKILKKYGGFFLLGVCLIIFYRYINITLFNYILNTFFPLILGAALAYFLHPLVRWCEKFFLKKDGFVKKHHCGLSVLLVFTAFIIIMIGILTIIIPACYNAILSLLENIDTYVKSYENIIHNIHNIEIRHILINCENKIISMLENLSATDPQVYLKTLMNAGTTIMNIILGLVFCPYILLERRHLVYIFDKICSIWLKDDVIKNIHRIIHDCDSIFGKFVYGKFLDSVIIGAIAFIGLGLLHLPYYPLMALVILVTNMVPYFGPFIGGIPVAIFALITNGPISFLAVGLFILILQQFDGLLLGPAILGDTVGISPFWIIASITVFGRLFGFIGMFLAVPIICMLRRLINDFIKYVNQS